MDLSLGEGITEPARVRTMVESWRRLATLVVVGIAGAVAFLEGPLPLAQAQRLSRCNSTLPHHGVAAIVVLGYSVDHTRGLPSEVVKSRVRHAFLLWSQLRHRRRPVVVFSGGSGNGIPAHLPTEADVMAAYFARLVAESGSPRAKRVLLERNSTSTRLNAVYSLRLVPCTPGTAIVLVTSTFHQARALLTFREALREKRTSVAGGCEVWSHCTPPAVRESGPTEFDFWREVAAFALYKVRGRARSARPGDSSLDALAVHTFRPHVIRRRSFGPGPAPGWRTARCKGAQYIHG